jgi:uncharacterized protein involved in exopolysaccharide biosynthesis/MinD-like ATPase involved in chromosome partitioning or flagellar assembly
MQPLDTQSIMMADLNPQDSISLDSALAALRRHLLMLLTITVLGTAAAAGVLYMIPSRYTASATLEVEPSEAPRVLQGAIVAPSLPQWMPGDNSTMSTQVTIVKSRALVRQVMAKLGLTHDPELLPMSVRIKTTLHALAQRWLPKPWQAAFTWDTHVADDVMQRQFLQRLVVSQDGTSHIILVSFTSVSATKAAAVANELVRQYIEGQLAAKMRATDQVYQWVAEQSRKQLADLTAAEKSEVDYMAAHRLIAADGRDNPSEGLAGQQLISIQKSLTEARAELAARQAKLNEVRALATQKTGYLSLPEVASSPVVIDLLKQDAELHSKEARLAITYGDTNAVLVPLRAQRAAIASRIAAEVRNVVNNVRDDLMLTQEREAALQQALLHSEQQYAQSGQSSVELRDLVRATDVKRTIYETLLRRANEIGEQRALLKPDAKLVSAAETPSERSSPKTLSVIGIGLIGSLAVGVLGAALIEHRDRSLRTARQAEQALGIPVLGVVPALRLEKGVALHRQVLRQPHSIYAEAVRAVLLGLQPRLGDTPKVIMVTSAIPREGKTTMALSLGATAAWAGKRTVVVDLDLRNPSIGSKWPQPVHAGLVEIMAGELPLQKAAYADPEEPHLHVIPVGGPIRNAAQALRGWDVRLLLSELRAHYDLIVLDLPPAIAISHIQRLNGLADAALYVVQWGNTTRSAAASGLAALSRTGVPVSGAVLTQVDMRRHALYDQEDHGEYHQKYLEYFGTRG